MRLKDSNPKRERRNGLCVAENRLNMREGEKWMMVASGYFPGCARKINGEGGMANACNSGLFEADDRQTKWDPGQAVDKGRCH